ncbi:MAG: type IX secretion system sortase PorU [Paludibacteraceae bacterium]|nr:type IX secretion system sortase PorU [Paludibacteraceae bacterium]
MRNSTYSIVNRIGCILIATLCTLALHAGVHNYANQSVLANGNWVKIQVEQNGIYCLTYEELANAGLNPQEVRIYGYGGAMLKENFTLPKVDDLPPVAFYMHTGDDAVFGKGDYILFYGQGNISWEYNNGYYTHTTNPYSRYGYYFLTDNAGEQHIITTEKEAIPSTNALAVNTYYSYQLHEEEKLNLIATNPAEALEGGGREWYGETILPNTSIQVPFRFQSINTNYPMMCRATAAASSRDISTLTLQINNTDRAMLAGGINPQDFFTKAYPVEIAMNNIPALDNEVKVTLQFSNNNSASKAYLNYIEITAVCDLHLHGPWLAFSNPSHYLSGQNSEYILTGATPSTEVWDITNPQNIIRKQIRYDANGTIHFVADNKQIGNFIAVNTLSREWLKPTIVGKVPNQNLHSIQQADYIIVTNEAFWNASLRLAKAHETIDGMSYAVVTDQQVYNEFSSGTPDASAIRWFAKMLYDRATTNQEKPKNLLLMGDGTYDNRKLSAKSGEAFMITYQAANSTNETKAYATDDYFGFLEDNDGISGSFFYDPRAKMRLGVGRLPVRSTEQAEAVVDKIIKYMNNTNLGKWKQQLCFLADDGDHNLHTKISDEAAELVRVKNPDFIVNKIYLDAYTQEVTASTERYPLAYNQFTNLLHSGTLFMNYSGHGSSGNICSEMFLSLKDVQDMTNENQGFWMLATCNYSHFDRAETSSAEEAVLNPHGGAIGVLSACRTVYASANSWINKYFCDTLFSHQSPYHYNMTIGEATYKAKNMTGNDENKMSYVLLGDPALRLNYPTHHQVVMTSTPDTLHALSKHTMQGYIRTDQVQENDNDTAYWFNGKLQINVYDKMQQTTTQDNDEPDAQKKVNYTFNDYANRLFSGETDVVNGKFSFTFMLPKDIRYNYGNARFVYYAYDTNYGEEAVGHYHQFVVGGSSPLIKKDSIGPELHIYLNNPAFVNGGKTHEFPHFYADIYDENGINMVGSGIGHDLLLVIDQDDKQSYILNDYFNTQNNSYQHGQVSYRLSEMSEGMHKLKFRAWDLHNNSSTATLDFEVVKGLLPTIYSVVTYPNPAPQSSTITIHIEYDKPDDLMEATLMLYDMSGRLVHSQTETYTDNIYLPLGEIGISPGIYLYQLSIRSSKSGYSNYASKIIVL